MVCAFDNLEKVTAYVSCTRNISEPVQARNVKNRPKIIGSLADWLDPGIEIRGRRGS